MFSLSNTSVQFNGIFLFSGVSFLANDGDRIGLVGKNGAGKSTILKVISGELSPESGDVSIPADSTIGYLPQELRCHHTKTVFQEAMEAYADIIELEKKSEEIAEQIANRNDYHSDSYMQLITDLSEINDKLSVLGGHKREAETEKVLLGLGFLREDFHKSSLTFSGGWRMRIELAIILLKRPDILLLDEPTNHLDIEAIQWLEEFLSAFPGTVILVSHDRAFLDNVTNRTIEITMGRIYDYPVSYSDYVELRQERLQTMIAAQNNQQHEIERIERFIERFRYKASKAKQVQSRAKLLGKIDMVEVDESDNSAIRFSFPPAPPCGKIALEAEKAGKHYGEKKVLENLDFVVNSGDKIAFVGRNGEGKTTLARMILREIEHEGSINRGHNVIIGYYAQNQDELLNPEQTVFETIDYAAVGEIRKKIRAILGSFLFSDDEIDKKVKVLSGGEKSRLALARLLLEPVNLLVLDEPTNHLDMRSKDILKSALIKFDGTLILVSHDRDFLQGLTNKVFEFRNHRIRQYFGDVYDFLESRKLESLRQLEKAAESAKKDSAGKQVSTTKQNYEDRKALDREIRKMRTRIEKMEHNIANMEAEIAEMTEVLSNPDAENAGLNDGSFFRDYNHKKAELEHLIEEWGKLSEDEHKLLRQKGN
ncbi:MAG: ATP-binding cassette domain-containing protein [Bacteroidetes bacterium]|nr:ATP-binding cassette domain-containing protein [Bacteroidota bacterium]MBU1720630.1 ATP-binding cassette domain-containing protein [Bacteroidota bacterium]